MSVCVNGLWVFGICLNMVCLCVCFSVACVCICYVCCRLVHMCGQYAAVFFLFVDVLLTLKYSTQFYHSRLQSQ